MQTCYKLGGIGAKEGPERPPHLAPVITPRTGVRVVPPPQLFSAVVPTCTSPHGGEVAARQHLQERFQSRLAVRPDLTRRADMEVTVFRLDDVTQDGAGWIGFRNEVFHHIVRITGEVTGV